jgi:hypothetical protein
MKVRRPMRPLPDRRAALLPEMRRAAGLVALRAHGRCEGCGAVNLPLETHHVFGRGICSTTPSPWTLTAWPPSAGSATVG